MKPQLIDTHCHLTHGRLRGALAEVIARAREAGVVAMVAPGSDVADSAAAGKIAGRHPGVYFAAGVHPHESASAGGDCLHRIEELAGLPGNVAVGEIGLDYHYDFSPRPAQKRVFAEQLALACRLDKPVVVHTREAFDDTLAILKESLIPGRRVVFHSFTEDAARVGRVVEFGAMVSFSGIMTFRNAATLREAAAAAPEDRILVETDAPYLSPEPVRRIKTNEPANVVHVARALAAVRGQPFERIAELTTANAARFFGLATGGTGL